MKIKNIKVGMIIKNYKELCKLLGIPVKEGNSKKTQLKALEQCCKFHKEGNKFVIDEILSTKPVIYEKGKNPNSHNNNSTFKDGLSEIVMFNLVNEFQNKTTEDQFLNISKTAMYINCSLVNPNFVTLYPNMEKVAKKEDIPIQVIEYFYTTSTSKMSKNIETVLNYMQKNFWINWSYRMSVRLVNGKTRLATDEETRKVITIQKAVLLEHGVKDMREIQFTKKHIKIQKEVNRRLKEELDFEYFFYSIYIVPSEQFEQWASKVNIEEVRKSINDKFINSTLKSAEKKHNKVIDECGIVVNDQDIIDTVGLRKSFIASPKFIDQITRLIDLYIKRGTWDDEEIQAIYKPILKEIQYLEDMNENDIANFIDMMMMNNSIE